MLSKSTNRTKLPHDQSRGLRTKGGEFLIGERIKELREEKGMTQMELAERMNCTRSMIHAYESGTRKPKIEMIGRFAEGLGCDVAELVDINKLIKG